jgi:hypothetical protein
MTILRNATGSITCAWLVSACYSLGNVFSGKRSFHQSRDELVVANSVWAATTFATVVFVSYLPLMRSLRFLCSPDKPPTIWLCLKRLVQATALYFAGSEIAVVTLNWLGVYISSAQPAVVEYKLGCYADNLSLLGYFTGISRAVREIYYQETVQGRSRAPKHFSPPAQKSSAKIKPAGLATPAPRQHFWQAYVRTLPSATPALMATGFVHVLSRQAILDQGTTAVSGFVVGGILFKLAIQELARRYILTRHVRSIRIMCVLVGIPTVLIDTQTRIILLGMNSTRTAVLGTLAMALIEVCLRVGKAKLVVWSIVQRQVGLWREIGVSTRRTAASSRQNSRKNVLTNGVAAVFPAPSRPSLSIMHVEFEVWRRQVQAYHTAELNADVYAEYISIGCSASILFFFSSHPHYSLLRQSESVDTELAVAAWRLNQLCMLGFQVGVEIIVDHLSIVLELMVGIEFAHITELGSFPAALFMVAATINIIISVGVYLS